uniref:Nanos-type domain-containing protein n=1 Tax=Haemonchus contortus TaxID=6289 RepID=A0A7I4XVE4_HAECO
MFSKVELELKKKSDQGKTTAESSGMKDRKAEVEGRKLGCGRRNQDVGTMFSERWTHSPDDVLAAIRNPSPNKPVKQLLQYRGKRSISNWDSSDSGSSSHYDETEQCSQGAESTTSDFFSGSDHACEVDLRSDTSSSPNQETPTAFASGLRSPQQAFQPTKQYRYCWYCYDVYSAMCLAQGKATPDIHSRGIWRGHCMKDAQGVTTCPHLWFTTCGHCGATADAAHSPEFCPVAKLASLNFQEN